MNILIKPTGLIVENIIQNSMGNEAFGTFAALNSLAFLFVVFLDLGINQFMIKELASNQEGVHDKLSGYFSLKIVLAILYPIFMIIIGYILGYSVEKIYWLFLISLGYCFFQLSMYLRSKFSALQKFNLDSLASISDKFFLIFFSLFLIVTSVTVLNYISVRLLAVFLTFIILFIPAWKLFSKKSFVLEWSISSWLTTLKFTYPFALITILYSIHDKVDQVMIERMIGNHASGLYAASYRWLDAFMMYLWIILPMFFSKFSYTKDNIGELNRLLKSAQVITAIPMIFISIFVWFHGEKLFLLLTNSSIQEVDEMASCLNVLFIAAFIHAYFAAFGTLLTAIGGEHFLNRMMLLTIALNIGLNLYMIPEFGIQGAAWATAICTLFLSVAYVYKLRQLKLYTIDLTITLKLVLYSMVITSCFYMCSLLHYSWFLSFTLVGIIMAFFVFASGLYKLLLKL